jgi:hypothetical protein
MNSSPLYPWCLAVLVSCASQPPPPSSDGTRQPQSATPKMTPPDGESRDAKFESNETASASSSTQDSEFGLLDPNAPASPPPPTALGRLQVSGPLPPEVVSRLLGQFNGRMRKCTIEHRTIEFSVSQDGTVARDSISVRPNDSCLAGVLGQVSFPEVAQPVNVVFEYEP